MTLAHLDVVICTHNRSAALAAVLARLSAQRDVGLMSWSVLVVDNASTDETPRVAEQYAASIPIRYVHEPRLGLTHARQRAVVETKGAWIAFVDDDNLLEPGWIAAIVGAILAYPNAGGIGGRVILQWETPPVEAVRDFGFCFAEQELGNSTREVESLVGAGMVLKRDALVTSGWIAEPLLDDRIGTKLVSGGDTEMALRVRAAGYLLRYAPDAVMYHRMPAGRASVKYLLRINRSLGATSAVISLLGWPDGYIAWRASARGNDRQRMREAVAGLWWSLRTRQKRIAAFAWLAFAIGFRQGITQVENMPVERRNSLLGLAAVMKPDLQKLNDQPSDRLQ
jgi:glycosyltransferase involved in cell wall biosynthesis